jgi:putative transposase
MTGQVAGENPGWGYQPIQGELRGLGIRVSACTVRRVLKRLRMPPAPQRTRSAWRRFLGTQAPALLAGDFFRVDCAVTWRRGCVFFVIEVSTRHGHVPGVTAHPDGARAVRQARNLLMDLGERGGRFRFLVRDRAGQFTGAFEWRCLVPGSRWVTIPPRSPRANASAGRWVRSPVRAHRPDADHRATAPGRGPGWSTPRTAASIARAEPGICARRTAMRSLPPRPPARRRREYDGEGFRAN